MVVANSGTPSTSRSGQDLTGQQSVQRAADLCGELQRSGRRADQPLAASTSIPIGTGEKIVPYGVGTGPSNVSVNARLSKVIGIGPKLEEGARGCGGGGGGYYGGPPGLGGGGLSGARGRSWPAGRGGFAEIQPEPFRVGNEYSESRELRDAERRAVTGTRQRRAGTGCLFRQVAVAGWAVLRVGYGGQPEHPAAGEL